MQFDRDVGEIMSAQSHNSARIWDLISGCISGFGAMVIMGYLANVTNPGIIDALVALISVGAVVVAFLCIGRASVEPSLDHAPGVRKCFKTLAQLARFT
jgi:hypothetical protein